MRVKDVMNKVVTIGEDIKLIEAAKKMSEKNIGSLVITRKEKIAGIITDTDIVRNADKINKRVSEVMSKNVVLIDENETLDKAAEIMKTKKIKRLPVMSDGKLVGIITATDILANSSELNENFFFE